MPQWELAMTAKLLVLVAGLAIAGLASIGAADADTCPVSDTCVTYDVFGSFAADEWLPPGPSLPSTPIPLRGTLYIDVTIGSVITSNLIIPGGLFSPLNIIDSQYSEPYAPGWLYQLNLRNAAGDMGYVDFIVLGDLSDILIANTYISIDQGEFDTAGPPYFVPFGLTGYIQATPLPAALPLFATGVGGLGLLGWRKKRKNATVLAAA